MKQEQEIEFSAQLFRALGHPTRVHFVRELARQPRCVSELQKVIDVDMSTVSKHLLVMKEAGIVTDERRGCQIFYHLAMPCVQGFLMCLDELWKEKQKGI